MAARLDYFFRQRVTEAELDLGFELLEQADRNLAADIGLHGVVSGAVPSPHSPVADLSIDLTAPGRAYDHLGQRIFFGTGQTVDCSVDLSGIPTEVGSAGNERWMGVFLRFRRLLSDVRTDGNSQQVYFRRDESFDVVVRQAAQGPIGSAQKPALVEDELLVCDVLRRAGQTQILASDIDTSRRQAFIFAQANSIALEIARWSVLRPAAATAQAALDETDAELAAHFSGAGRRHPGTAIDVAPRGFVTSNTVQAALHELIDKLTSTAMNDSGASRIGVDGLVGNPNLIAAGTLRSQLLALLDLINGHVANPNGAHDARAISAQPFDYVSATNVQAQLSEVVADLRSTAPNDCGSDRVGVQAVSGASFSVGPASLTGAFIGLILALERHTLFGAPAHPSRAILLDDNADRYAGNTVADALQEAGSAFEGDHFRANEPNPGQHRTIHQPVLGGGRVLIWESAGQDTARSHLRVYLDEDGVWFVFNAAWDGSGWQKQSLSIPAGGMRIWGAGIETFHENSSNASFLGWTNTLRVALDNPTSNSGFESRGVIREVGRCGSRIRNAEAGQRTLVTGHGVTFRTRFASPPSSVTLTPLYVSPNTPTATADAITVDGFAFWMSANVATNATALWVGTYTAIA
jgi:hypothetical protein